MLELVEEHRCCGGVQRTYKHDSESIGLPMRFSVFLPPQASEGKVPALFYLAGLTCTEETFPIKAGAQRYAAEHGIGVDRARYEPARSRRAERKCGVGFRRGCGLLRRCHAGTVARNYRMYSYVTQDLRATVLLNCRCVRIGWGFFGHSMGGHARWFSP